MNHTFELLGFQEIKERLAECAVTEQGKRQARELTLCLKETELKKRLRDTTQARQMLELAGSPPLPLMKQIEENVLRSVKGELLLPEEIEEAGYFLVAVQRLKTYLEKGKARDISLAYYSENLSGDQELCREIQRCIRSGQVDDYASPVLGELRRQVQNLEEKIREKAEQALRAAKSYTADSYIVNRNGHICIPVKKACRSKVAGAVIDQSATGSTLFIEPKAVGKLCGELELLKIQEDTEIRRILYQLTDEIAQREDQFLEDIRVTAMLDFVFAKGKMSLDMEASEPEINVEGRIYLERARHPLLDKKRCVPLDFSIGDGIRGMVITGPNTGGKTVAIKTVGLLTLMACSGLHIPCERAEISMCSQILCDIGDGQNLQDNLSTFSAHIQNIIQILRKATKESLVILDELGSGTDPAEGMGIAIAVLEELRKRNCLFLVTTHYPEVKEYADRWPEIEKARMAFDKETLKPLYRLEMGKAGDSCALYIAKRLGLPNGMLLTAAKEAYGELDCSRLARELNLEGAGEPLTREPAPRIIREKITAGNGMNRDRLHLGDSVTVLPQGKIGIVAKAADSQGNVLVQIKKEKILVNQKRVRLLIPADRLYPEDYDFSIIFDSVKVRKARHQMERKYQKDLVIEQDSQ